MGQRLEGFIDTIIDRGIDSILVTEIHEGIKHLPDSLLDKGLARVLTKIRPHENRIDRPMEASAFGANEIIIKQPFNLSAQIYAEMDKRNGTQRCLMDLGTIAYLYDIPMVSSSVNEETKALLRKHKEGWNGSIKRVLSELLPDILKGVNEKGLDETMSKNELETKLSAHTELINGRHIMDGVSTINCQEKLLQWIIRHEIGHAVDEMMNWSANLEFKEPLFGGWEIYHNPGEALQQYRKCGGIMADEDFEKCFTDFSFTYNDGGQLQANGRIFMLDEYGHCCSYLAAARNNAVSNYQFAAPNEWFAEAFAAYYGPNIDNAATNCLDAGVINFFEREIERRVD